MMEEQDILDEASGDYSSVYQGNETIDDHSVHLPASLAYLSLGFRVMLTVIIVLMTGWVIITIKTTRSLHKIHNIYIANLMATDAVSALISLLLTSTMMMGYHTGMGDLISCNVFKFLLFPVVIVDFTFLMIAVDKVIAVTFPLRYAKIMKPRVVFGIITMKWVLAALLFIHNLFNPKGFTKVAKFGTCISNDNTLLGTLVTHVIPVVSASLLTAILNIYLTIKAYQVHKQIQEEKKLSGHNGNTDQLQALKKKQATIKKHLKPMITLLVVVLGTSSIGLLFPLLFIVAVFLDSPTVYEEIVRYVVAPTIGFISLLFHPFVYGLYFKQVRMPMMSLLRRINCSCKCKSATVAPLPQRQRINWMHPN